MKTTTRGKLLMALCAVLVAALACLPLAWFAWQDSRLFGTVDTVSDPYDHRAVTGEDFYLLNQVKARAQAMADTYRSVSYQDESALYSSAGNRRDTMKQDMYISNYATSLLHSLNEAGALPDAWYAEAVSGMRSYDTRLYTSSDSLGITRLTLFPHDSDESSDNYYYEIPRFALDFDPKTGKVLALWIQVPVEGNEASDRAEDLTAPLDTQAVLDAWVEWEGLSALGDWAMPARGQYAETGTYSPSGEALLTCVNGTWRADGADRAYFSMQLNWQARDPDFVPGEDTNLVPQGDLERLSSASDTAMYTIQIAPKQAADGSYVFCHYSSESTPYMILRTDFITGEQSPFCDVPGCDHMSDSCPARISFGGGITPTVAAQGSKAYVFLRGLTSSAMLQEETLAKMSDEEVMRWYYAMNAGVPAALYTKELSYSAEEAAYIRQFLGGEHSNMQVWVLDGSSQRLLADWEDTEVDFQWADDDYFYGIASAADPSEYDQWVRMDKTNGGYSTMPIPDAEQVLGVCGGKLILEDFWNGEPYVTGNSVETALTAGYNYNAICDNQKQLVLSYDPETDELHQLFCLPGFWTTVASVYGGNVYLDYTEIDGTEHHTVRLNVESGATTLAETLFHVSFEGEYAGYYLRGNMGYDCSADNWIIWQNSEAGSALLMDLDTGFITDPPVRSDLDTASNPFYLLGTAWDGRLLLGWYEYMDLSGRDTTLGTPWYSELRQYLAPADDLSDLTPVRMWQPGSE